MVVPRPIDASGPTTAPGSTTDARLQRVRFGRRESNGRRAAVPRRLRLQGVGIEQRKHLGEGRDRAPA